MRHKVKTKLKNKTTTKLLKQTTVEMKNDNRKHYKLKTGWILDKTSK